MQKYWKKNINLFLMGQFYQESQVWSFNMLLFGI